MTEDQGRRAYISPVRDQRAADVRMQIIRAADGLLRGEGGKERYSVDAVAVAAGTARSTIYRHFGSHRGLLEAVLDYISERTGVFDLQVIRAEPDPLIAIDKYVDLQCKFWNGEPALMHLFDEATTDPELEKALQRRVKVGQDLTDDIVARAMPNATSHRRRDARDMIFAVLLPPSYRYLSATRSPSRVAALMKKLCRAALED